MWVAWNVPQSVKFLEQVSVIVNDCLTWSSYPGLLVMQISYSNFFSCSWPIKSWKTTLNTLHARHQDRESVGSQSKWNSSAKAVTISKICLLSPTQLILYKFSLSFINHWGSCVEIFNYKWRIIYFSFQLYHFCHMYFKVLCINFE